MHLNSPVSDFFFFFWSISTFTQSSKTSFTNLLVVGVEVSIDGLLFTSISQGFNSLSIMKSYPNNSDEFLRPLTWSYVTLMVLMMISFIFLLISSKRGTPFFIPRYSENSDWNNMLPSISDLWNYLEYFWMELFVKWMYLLERLPMS